MYMCDTCPLTEYTVPEHTAIYLHTSNFIQNGPNLLIENHAHTQRRGHRRRTRVHRQGVNVSTNAMWSTRAREFLTHTAGSHCQEAPVLPLHAHAYPCPHRLALQTRAERRHVQTWEHVCEQGHTGSHADDPTGLCVLSCALVLVPPPPTACPQLPKGPWDRVPVSPSSGATILPSPCSFQLALSPETDLGISGPRF